MEKVIPSRNDAEEEMVKQDLGQISEQLKSEESSESNAQSNNLSVRTKEELPIKTETELSVRTDKEKTIRPIVAEIKSVVSENDYVDHQSKYVMQLDRLQAERDVWYSLSKFFDSTDEAGLWVSEKYRCLIDVLLTFTEMKRIELDDLKEVCNAFTDVINSDYYQCLHPSYPYTTEIKKLRDQIKTTCINTLREHFKYRIGKEKKQNLILTRFELSQFVGKSKFSELKFREK